MHMHTRFLSLANIHMCVLMICKIKVDVNHSVEEGVFCFWGVVALQGRGVRGTMLSRLIIWDFVGRI